MLLKWYIYFINIVRQITLKVTACSQKLQTMYINLVSKVLCILVRVCFKVNSQWLEVFYKTYF